jgi:hypothetical protein
MANLEDLQGAVMSELGQKELFELVRVTPGQLEHWSGTRTLKAEDKLPKEFTTNIRNALGCDAILFSRLTRYRAYPPMEMGWNLKLIDASSPTIWWAAEASFNAGDPSVALAARRFHKEHFRDQGSLSDSHTVLNSPSRFAQYTLNSLFALLPKR